MDASRRGLAEARLCCALGLMQRMGAGFQLHSASGMGARFASVGRSAFFSTLLFASGKIENAETAALPLYSM